METTSIAKYLILMGGLLILIGLIYYFFQDKLLWIGQLPGDFRIEKEGGKFYFPLTSMLILSIVLSLLINFLKRFF